MKLNSLFALIFLAPALSFGNTCFVAASNVPHEVPKHLCLEKLVESDNDELLAINGNAYFPAILKITETSRHNEERLNFTATAELYNVWNSGCGDGLVATLKVKGQIAYGQIHTDDLKVTVDIESTNDTCHSTPSLETVLYPLK